MFRWGLPPQAVGVGSGDDWNPLEAKKFRQTIHLDSFEGRDGLERMRPTEVSAPAIELGQSLKA